MAPSGPTKPSNRFTVRVFKPQSNIPPSYPVNGKNDLGGYRQPPPREQQREREQQNMAWFPPPPSNVYAPYDSRPRATANYAIYPGAIDGTFIYEQSACSKSDIFSYSDMDSASMATFSPAMSTDSTVTLPSTNAGERPVEYQKRSDTPAPRADYPSRAANVSQGPALSRVTSTHRPADPIVDEPRSRTPVLPARSSPPTHPPASAGRVDPGIQPIASSGYPIEIPEYAASSVSEMEVQERHSIAKINAEYNSASTGSLYSGGSSSPPEDARRMPAITRNASVLNRDSVAFNPSQQPLHPGLRFPSRVPEETILPHPAMQMNGASGIAVFPQAFPAVERVASQMPPPEHQAHPASFQMAYQHPVDPRVPPGLPRGPSYQTSPKRHATVPPPTTHYSGQSTYSTSAPDSTGYNDHRIDRVPSTFVEMPRSRRQSFVGGARPDVNLQRQPSDVRDAGSSSRGQSDYRYDDAGRRVSEAVQSPTREVPYSGRPDPPSRNSSSSSPRDVPRSAVPSDLRRETRTPSPKEYDDGRNSYASRRDSYFDSSRPSRDRRPSFSHGNEMRDVYGSGALSSSPVQLRESPTEIEPTFSRRGGVPSSSAEYEQARERPRTRSTSFSAAVRPTLPTQSSGGQVPSSQQAQAYELKRSDSRYASDEERYTRSGEWSGSKGPADSARSANQHDFERRPDTVRTGSSQAPHYSQSSLPPTSAPYEPTSQRQTTSGPGSGTMPSPPRSLDRVNSVMQPQASQTRGGHVQENVSSRSRSAYPEPAYNQPQPPPQPLQEPVRRHSDPEKHYSSRDSYAAKDGYSTNDAYSSKDRSSRPPEPQGASVKISGQESARVANVLSAGTPSSEPQRRNSDGDQHIPLRPSLSGRMSAPLLRSVRWNDNLICPSPIPASARRKGWFNRRGDQLWTNDGQYKVAPVGQEFPPDLDDYPEFGEGWMNEECVRIDLNHRLVPKPPLRSALKGARN